MIISTVMLENFCQHKSRELTFDTGVTFITGSNGAGKSNLFRAIRGTLTGDFDSRSMNGKSQDVTYGLSKGADATVSSHWDLGKGRAFEVKRSIINTGAASLWELGQKTFVGKEAEVTDRVMQLLGVSREVVQDCMFIGQRKVSDVFEVSNSVRIDNLIGLTDAAKAIELLQILRKRHNKYTVYLDDFDQTEVASSQNDYSRVKQVYQDVKSVYDEIKSRMLLPIEQEQINKVVQSREKYDDLKKQIEKADKGIDLLDDVIKDADEQQKKYAAAKKRAEKKVAVIKSKYDKAYQQYENAVAINNSYKHYQDLQKQLATPLPERPEGKPLAVLPDDEVERLEDLVRSYNSLIQMYHDKECVTCKRPFDVSEEDFNKTEKKLAYVERKLADNQKSLEENRDIERAISAYKVARDKVKHIRETAKQSIERLYPEPPQQVNAEEPDASKLDTAEELLKKYSGGYTVRKQKYDSLNGQMVQATNDLQLKRRQLEKLAKPTDDEYKQALASWEKHQEASLELDEASDQLRKASNELSLAIRRLRSANFSKRKIKKLEPVAEVIKDAVEVCKKLPGRTIAEMAKRMEPEINGKLEQMGADFTLSVNELLEFSVTRNGHTFPRSRMSGGQKCVAGIAFWMTVADVAGLDCIFMDEPIDGLDAEAEAMLPDTFTRLDASFRATNKQLIVVTHHRQLAQVGNRIHIG